MFSEKMFRRFALGKLDPQAGRSGQKENTTLTCQQPALDNLEPLSRWKPPGKLDASVQFNLGVRQFLAIGKN